MSEPVAEHEAKGEIARVYHEVRQVLRVSGVNLVFRTWARHDELFPPLWDALRPNLETVAFERAADAIRRDAVRAAADLGPVRARDEAALGESQSFRVQGALRLYHYVNPKLLVLAAAARMRLAGEAVGGGPDTDRRQIILGEPPRMHPMEMVDEKPDDRAIRRIFDDIKESLSLPSVNSDYRTLALFPTYLATAWTALRPIATGTAHREAADRLRRRARELTAALPHEIPFDRARARAVGGDVEGFVAATERFEQLLAGLVLNVALLFLEWAPVRELERSPYPAEVRP